MNSTPWRLFLAIGSLVLLWVAVFWLYEPSAPPVSFGERPATLTDAEVHRASQAVRANSAEHREAPASRTTEFVTPGPDQRNAKSNTPGSANPAPEATIPGWRETREYTIQKGDISFEQIAARLYGDRRRGPELARENPFVTPNKLVPGRTVIRVPVEAKREPSATVAGNEPVRPKVSPAEPAKPNDQERLYTIKRNDTLSGIAKEVYGQSSKWREIFDANRERIPDPDRLPLGVVIRIPRLAGAGS